MIPVLKKRMPRKKTRPRVLLQRYTRVHQVGSSRNLSAKKYIILATRTIHAHTLMKRSWSRALEPEGGNHVLYLLSIFVPLPRVPLSHRGTALSLLYTRRRSDTHSTNPPPLAINSYLHPPWSSSAHGQPDGSYPLHRATANFSRSFWHRHRATFFDMGDYHSWRTWKRGRASDMTSDINPLPSPWFIDPYHPRLASPRRFPSPHTPHLSHTHGSHPSL